MIIETDPLWKENEARICTNIMREPVGPPGLQSLLQSVKNDLV